MNPRVVIALSLVCVAALGAVVLVALAREDARSRAGERRFEGATLPRGLRAPDFRLRDQDGRSVSMAEFRGRPVVVTFLYTDCEETCPSQVQTIKGAFSELGRDLPALAVAVDPPRDDARRARLFLARQRMTDRMRFALGSRDELRPVWRGFAVRPQREDAEHSGRLVLVDGRGVQRVSYPIEQATPEGLAHDLRLLESGA